MSTKVRELPREKRKKRKKGAQMGGKTCQRWQQTFTQVDGGPKSRLLRETVGDNKA